MSPRTTRRALLRAGSLTLLGASAGCLGRDAPETDGPPTETRTATETRSPTATERPTPTATGVYASQPDGPEPYPERPDDATPDAAVEYAKAFERARVHNSLHEPDVEDLSARGTAAHDTTRPGGHYVVATGGGYANYADDLHADWGQLPALFFVSPALVVRVAEFEDHYFHCTDVFASDDESENFGRKCEGEHAEYRVYNVHPEPHDLSVTVEYLGDDGPTTVLEREYSVSYDRGVQQGSVTRRKGAYRLTASIPDGPALTHEWDLTLAPLERDSPLSVLVTPSGGLRVHRPPFGNIR